MSITLYASFSHPVLAERAAGALLDHGVMGEHISLVRNDNTTSTKLTGSEEIATDESAYTSGMIVPGPGTVPASGSAGIQPGANQMSMSSPSSAGLSQPSPGYDAMERTAMQHGQGFVDDGNATDDALAAMRDTDIAGGSGVPPYSSGVAGGGAGFVPVEEQGEPVEKEADPEEIAKYGITTTTAKDAGSGALKGTGVGIGVGILAGLASLIVPGVGFVVGGGALAIAIGGLAGSAGAGAAAGAVYGYLKDQGMEDHIANQYASSLDRGGALLAVHCPSGTVGEAEMRQIMDKYGALSVGYVGSKGYIA